MAIICPTVTASEPHEYREQVERIAPFAQRIHIDLADGVFTTNKLISLKKIWWPVGVTVDVHLMYKSVRPFLNQLTDHKPSLVIMHAEAVGSYYKLARELKKHGIKVGVALLQDTPVNTIAPAIDDIDHVLIFSGDLGHFGGTAQLSLLSKVTELKKLKQNIEIGWDGGINKANVTRLAAGGIDVLNTGGAIQRAKNPEAAYLELQELALKTAPSKA